MRPLSLLCLLAIQPIGWTQSMVFPDAEWKRATPASQAIDDDALGLALDFLESHCKDDGLSEVMVIRNGIVVWEGTQTTKVHNIWSCSKTFTSTVLGLLIDEGKCRLDTKISTVLPELAQHYPDANLRHFTTMTSGYSGKGRSRWDDENSDWSWTPYTPEGPLFEPGTAYAYWDEAQMTLGRALTKIAGEPIVDYLAPRLFDPIGMGDVEWGTEGEVDGLPINNGCTGVLINARQMARFGLLFLNRGKWNDTQVIPAAWVDAATQNQVPTRLPVGDTDRDNVKGPGCYGYNWWTNGQGEWGMPDAPPRTFYNSGLNHNVCVVVPEWNLVFVRMGVDGNPEFGKHNVINGFLARLGRGIR